MADKVPQYVPQGLQPGGDIHDTSMVTPTKRILLIAPQPIYEDRGTPIAVDNMLKAFSNLGYAVDLATFPQGANIDYPNLRVFRTSNPLRYGYVSVGFSIRKVVLDICLTLTAFGLSFRNQYDCLHGVEEGAAIALIIKKLLGIPVIYDMQSSMAEQLKKSPGLGSGPGRWLCLWFERWLIRSADCVFASRGLARHALSINREQAVLECNFPGLECHSPDSKLVEHLGICNRPTVVYTGTFANYQGLANLLEAIAMVRETYPEIVVLLIGGTEIETAGITRTVQRMGIGDNVQIFTRRPRQEIPAFLSIADVLVLPRVNGENAPLKLFDYMKSGKPIVATDIPAHRALLSDKTAILVEPQAQALCDGIMFGLGNFVVSQKVAQAALVQARSNETDSLNDIIKKAFGFVFANRA